MWGPTPGSMLRLEGAVVGAENGGLSAAESAVGDEVDGEVL